MKLRLTNILNELKPEVPPEKARQMQQRSRIAQLMQRVDQGQVEVSQTKDPSGSPVRMYYKGGVLHREEGPAILPSEASEDTPAPSGGEYYLYGKKLSDFSTWYRQVERLRSERERLQDKPYYPQRSQPQVQSVDPYASTEQVTTPGKRLGRK